MKKLSLSLSAISLLLAAPVFADEDDKRYYEENKAQLISYEKAKEIAIKASGGGEVREIEFDYNEYLGARFELDVIFEGMDHEIEIDAKTGEISHHETKRDD